LANPGHTSLEVSNVGKTGELKREVGPLNRRITGETSFEMRGVAAGHELVKTKADPSGKKVRGTLNNCSGGITPWGTFLSGEENFEQYWANADKAKVEGKAKEDIKRFDHQEGASERKWERLHDRLEHYKEPNEFHRFGRKVEVA